MSYCVNEQKMWVNFWVFFFIQEGNKPPQTSRNHRQDPGEEHRWNAATVPWPMAALLVRRLLTMTELLCRAWNWLGAPSISRNFQLVLASFDVLLHVSSPGGKQPYHSLNLIVFLKIISSLKVCREESNKCAVNTQKLEGKCERFSTYFPESYALLFNAYFSLTHLD